MTTVLERPTEQIESIEPKGTVRTVERRPAPQLPPPTEPTRFVRWMGWLMVMVVLVAAGIFGLVWWNQSQELVAPSVEAIDPHVNPEILRIGSVALVTPSLESIDPHDQP